MPVELKEIDNRLAKKIHSLATAEKDQVREALKGYFNDIEINATLDRLKSLAKFLEPMIETEDGHVISKV